MILKSKQTLVSFLDSFLFPSLSLSHAPDFFSSHNSVNTYNS